MTRPWDVLGAVPPADLRDARLQIHWAAQIAQSHGRSLLVPRDDDSHACLLWDDGNEWLVGRAAHHHAAALRPRDLTLVFLETEQTDGGDEAPGPVSGRVVDEFPLRRRSLSEARDWLRARMDRNAAAHTLDTPWELDEHPVSEDDEPFLSDAAEVDPAALAELARWFATGAGWLAAAADAHGGGEVRLWAHHLDVATLVELPPIGEEGVLPPVDLQSKNDDAASLVVEPTIGIGLSPGDESYAEPYLYIAPWPYPDDDEPLPPLSGPAFWHGEHFVAAVLTATDLFATDDRAATVERFTEEAVAACRALHDRLAEKHAAQAAGTRDAAESEE